MEKYIIDEKTSISYTLQRDYYIPDLALPSEEQNIHLGIWGMRYKRYLMQNRKAIFNVMIANGILWKHLSEIDKQADKMFFQLVNDMAKAENITEQIKAEDQMLWVQKMNNIRSRATEVVNEELIYK